MLASTKPLPPGRHRTSRLLCPTNCGAGKLMSLFKPPGPRCAARRAGTAGSPWAAAPAPAGTAATAGARSGAGRCGEASGGTEPPVRGLPVPQRRPHAGGRRAGTPGLGTNAAAAGGLCAGRFCQTQRRRWARPARCQALPIGIHFGLQRSQIYRFYSNTWQKTGVLFWLGK